MSSDRHRTHKSPDGTLQFVIQEHGARTLHYDLRLESRGRLLSWAVPKGLSTDPREKRLAIRTDDHPLEYADFEGTIPAGEPGAGSVIVWDRGEYEHVTERDDEQLPLEKALDGGHAVVRLDGQKLRGRWALQRIDDSDREQWLVIKVDDEQADARRNPVSTEPASVKSGKTLNQVAEGSEK